MSEIVKVRLTHLCFHLVLREAMQEVGVDGETGETERQRPTCAYREESTRVRSVKKVWSMR